MAYRTFADENGCYWQAWESHPSIAERRHSDRRVSSAKWTGIERRINADRRISNQKRVVLGGALANGWLTFESPREKRRIAPIPHSWEALSVPELCVLCRSAVRVGRVEEDFGAA